MARTQAKTDDTRPRTGRPAGSDSEVTAEIVESGRATMTQLAQMFGTDTKTLPARLRGIQAAGKNKRGYRVYSIAEAATRIVRPGYEIEEYIRQMSPQELPPLLSKEYWNGQNARIKFETEMGRYWPTDRVVEAFGGGLAALRMSILLIQDGVEREEVLSAAQRAAVQRLMDSAINDARDAIVEKMKEFDCADELEDDGAVHGLEGEDDRSGLAAGLLDSEDDEEEDIGI